MDQEIREAQRREDEFEILRKNTRAGIKTTITNSRMIWRCIENGFIPLARYNVNISGFFVSKREGTWGTSKCNHPHKTKKAAKNCLNRARQREWERQVSGSIAARAAPTG